MSTPVRFRRVLPAIAALIALLPATADAHLAIKGLGEIGNGALHPLITPTHLLVLLGTALLAARQDTFKLKAPMIALAVCSSISLGLAQIVSIPGIPLAFLACMAMGIGVLVALEKAPPAWVCTMMFGIAAAGIGLDSAAEYPETLPAIKSLAGTWIGMNLVTGYAALCFSHANGRPWAQTAIRIVGSWIFAISALVIAFSLRRN